MKEKPLWWRLYNDPAYVAVARSIGYQGCTVRDLGQKIEDLSRQFDKHRVQSAVYHLATFDGQMTCNPPQLAKVELRAHVRQLCWQLLGVPPDHPDYASFHPEAAEPEVPDTDVTEPKAKPTRKRGKGK
jgi:hypothetical protein